MARRKVQIPDYGTTVKAGIRYYRTRIMDADGKRVDLYAETKEELYEKEKEARQIIEEAIFRRENPTVEDYAEKWLTMQSATISPASLKGYESTMRKYIVDPLGNVYMADVTTDDIRLALVPASSKSASVYNKVNMILKSMFRSAYQSNLIDYDPCTGVSGKGGVPQKTREALTDEEVQKLLEATRDLPPYPFIMIGLYAGLRREEILALKWDCVFLDVKTPYISVRRAWRSVHNRPVISTVLKTEASNRDVPIPANLADYLREQKATSKSDYVIADSLGQPLAYSQFRRVWNYVDVRSTKERTYYRYVNGTKILHTVKPILGERARHNADVIYSMDFSVTPHQLRHTYITNLIHAGVDPKTVQYLAGHENSKMTMDIYAKVKYNRPAELFDTVNNALSSQKEADPGQK